VERDRWDRLRQEVRAALTSRGVAVPALAARLGKATSTLKSALETKSPPSQVLQQQLTDWLATQEVAAEPAATVSRQWCTRRQRCGRAGCSLTQKPRAVAAGRNERPAAPASSAAVMS
jgi:lambda repressor-like predicted transcriptional regulator